MLMVLVDNIGGCCFKEWVHHSPWDVIHLADFVMPLFLFMVRRRLPAFAKVHKTCDAHSHAMLWVFFFEA